MTPTDASSAIAYLSELFPYSKRSGAESGLLAKDFLGLDLPLAGVKAVIDEHKRSNQFPQIPDLLRELRWAHSKAVSARREVEQAQEKRHAATTYLNAEAQRVVTSVGYVPTYEAHRLMQHAEKNGYSESDLSEMHDWLLEYAKPPELAKCTPKQRERVEAAVGRDRAIVDGVAGRIGLAVKSAFDVTPKPWPAQSVGALRTVRSSEYDSEPPDDHLPEPSWRAE